VTTPNQNMQQIEDSMSDAALLTLIAAGQALTANTEYRLEDLGLIEQTDEAYARITSLGRKLMKEGA
jgi:Mn-dependent DtxR family transcriptional regulator